MNKIRVLVVDDSAFMRMVISDIINNCPEMETVGKARDGCEALQKIKELKPDVVTLDVEMPGMDGFSTLENIMRDTPIPVIMLSSLTKSGAEQTMRALQMGAIDFITKPSGQISLDINQVKEDIIKKISMAAGTQKKLQNLYNKQPVFEIIKAENKTLNLSESLKKIVLIGTSTGGPKALHEVIPKFPSNMGAAVLVVQHMPPGFTKSLADRLESISHIRVKEAEQGEKIVPGCAYIAPGDFHLRVNSRESKGEKELLINLDKSPLRGGHRPAVDVMLESVVEKYWGRMVCVIMTGMGSDGAAGLEMVKDKGGITIAEHQSTCIVYGMPKSAVGTGKVDKVVALNEISSEVLKALKKL